MAGALADRGFGLLFAVDAVTCLACAAIVWRWVPPDTAPAAAHDEPGRLRDVLEGPEPLLLPLVGRPPTTSAGAIRRSSERPSAARTSWRRSPAPPCSTRRGGRVLWGACAALGLVATAGQLAIAPAIARRTGRA